MQSYTRKDSCELSYDILHVGNTRRNFTFNDWRHARIVCLLKGTPLLQHFFAATCIKRSYYYLLSVVYKYASLFIDGYIVLEYGALHKNSTCTRMYKKKLLNACVRRTANNYCLECFWTNREVYSILLCLCKTTYDKKKEREIV